jgi:hypothetical protein
LLGVNCTYNSAIEHNYMTVKCVQHRNVHIGHLESGQNAPSRVALVKNIVQHGAQKYKHNIINT